MADDTKRLLGGLRRLRRRARAVRGLKLSGRALLGVSAALFLLFGVREWLRARWGVELLPLHGLRLLVACAGAVLLAPAAATVAARFGGPSLETLARALDRRVDARDLCAAALTARGGAGPVAREVVRRAAERVGALDPEEVFPARRSLAKLAAVLPLALLAVYLLGLSPGAGPLPLGAGAGGGVSKGPGPAAAAPPAGEETPEAKPGEAGAAPSEKEKPDQAATPRADEILARVVPAKEVYGPKDPVTVFVQAKPGGELSRGRSLSVSVVVDGKEAPADATLAVGPAADAGAVAPVLLKAIPQLTDTLTPGKHRVSAVLRDDAVEIRTPEVEIEIRGEPGGGGSPPPKPEPKPRPKPSGGPPPSPEVNPRPKFVVPLFREGEMRKKEGYALVPDPEAPPGTPPRRVPLEKAAREAGRRPESDVPVERLRPGDRALVRDYFDALREGK